MWGREDRVHGTGYPGPMSRVGVGYPVPCPGGGEGVPPTYLMTYPMMHVMLPSPPPRQNDGHLVLQDWRDYNY